MAFAATYVDQEGLMFHERRQRQILGMANTCQHHDHYSQGSRPRKKEKKIDLKNYTIYPTAVL